MLCSTAPIRWTSNLSVVELLLVRHADAGSKSEWDGDDSLRPLSAKGRDEAAAIVDILAQYEPIRIVSSPLVRCVQTVAPLSLQLGLAVEEMESLGPATGGAAVAFARELAAGRGPVVVCTHREIIEVLERRLVGRRKTAPQPKGSVWVIQASKGRFRSADYLPPAGFAIRRQMGYTARSRVE
ncbi:MAG: SixA phosphatase family protein [Solirubrobacteraceae bacterium]